MFFLGLKEKKKKDTNKKESWQTNAYIFNSNISTVVLGLN